jgi:pimeloyl-ACP methyl ester carboxylesterase
MAEHGPTIVLVHGAWFGSWVWAEMTGRLEATGIATRAIDLPGVGRAPGGHDLAGHSAALRSLVASIEGPVAVCSHSYGGVVASQALGGAAATSPARPTNCILLGTGRYPNRAV